MNRLHIEVKKTIAHRHKNRQKPVGPRDSLVQSTSFNHHHPNAWAETPEPYLGYKPNAERL